MCALDIEYDALLKYFPSVREEKTEEGLRLAVCETDSFAAVRCGVGKSAAAFSSDVLLDRYPELECLYSVGMAGALSDSLDTGDIVLGTAVVDVGDGAVLELMTPAEKLQQSDGIYCGNIVCSPVLVDSEKQRVLYRKSFGGICAEMECAGVARICRRRGVEAAAVKVISDRADSAAMVSLLRAQISVTEKLGAWLHAVREFL